MKLTEMQLDGILSRHAEDGTPHVVHDKSQNFTVTYIINSVVNDEDSNGDPIQGLSILAAVARRNPEDNFNRRLGRLISKGRLVSGASTSLLYQDFAELPSTSLQWRALDRFVVNSLNLEH